MRWFLRLLTVVSFGVFVVAATLAFSVRAAPGPLDGGSDAGSRPALVELLGSTPERDALAGSKAFGAPVTPPGFSGFGGLGSGGGTFVAPSARLVDVKVTGPQSREVVERLVRRRLGIRFGDEPCSVQTGDVVATLDITAAGATRAVRVQALGDAGSLQGIDCLSSRLGELVLPPLKQASTVTLTLHLEAARVR